VASNVTIHVFTKIVQHLHDHSELIAGISSANIPRLLRLTCTVSNCARSEVITSVTKKIAIFWLVTVISPRPTYNFTDMIN
jgi:hypothetical protein